MRKLKMIRYRRAATNRSRRMGATTHGINARNPFIPCRNR